MTCTGHDVLLSILYNIGCLVKNRHAKMTCIYTTLYTSVLSLVKASLNPNLVTLALTLFCYYKLTFSYSILNYKLLNYSNSFFNK